MYLIGMYVRVLDHKAQDAKIPHNTATCTISVLVEVFDVCTSDGGMALNLHGYRSVNGALAI
jgi:hypothetical protein